MDDIEERLRRVRPVGPPPALRARVMVSVREAALESRDSAVAWLPAAAAVMLITLFSWMSSMERGRIESRVSSASEDSVSALATETWP